jgi:hypothetical protein
MTADMVKVIAMIAAINAAVAIVMIPVSVIISAWALNWLEKFDWWLSRKHEKRPFAPIDKA